MKNAPGAHLLSITCIAAILGQYAHASTARERLRFDGDWRFQMDSLLQTNTSSANWTYQRVDGITLQDATPPASPDGEWKPTRPGADLFHNRVGFVWMHATLSPSRNPRQVAHFDGVDDNAAVFLNGVRVGSHEGYGDPFDVDLSKAWKSDQPNELYVLVENTAGPGGLMGSFTVQASEGIDRAPKTASATFDDGKWRTVHLPHDYVVEGTFTPTADASHGSLPVTPAWYRKTFELPTRYRGKSIWLDFDGVYRDSTVWLNGHKLGTNPSGYVGSRYDISRWVHLGAKNVLAVRVDPRRPEGWWYEGGGIYRHVWLNVADLVHIAPDSQFVRSEVKGSEGASHPSADVLVDTQIQNDSGQTVTRSLLSKIYDPEGALVAEATTKSILVPAYSSVTLKQKLSVRRSELWSVDSPHLYSLKSEVLNGLKQTDIQHVSFGIRTIRFDANLGFFLNGKPFKIKGTCNHQDHAGVGIAVPDSLFAWRVSQLKKMGSNAYRMSHNPPAKELLDECDRQGMIVMDENRHLGDTPAPKTAHGTKFEDLSELKSMILRDRNHPSIVMWSMCNEELLEGSPEGGRIFDAMQKVTKQLDPTRPVTSAMNGGWEGGTAIVEELLGVNYAPGVYDHFHKVYPAKPMYGSETASTVSTRGIYANDPVKGYVSAYDVNFPGWAQTAEDAWQPLAERPWMAGGYVWTGFDYKGEPTPYSWPCINSHFGIMDICGFPKDNYFYYQAWWGSAPVVHLLPHWNWAGSEGKPIDVWCYSNGDSVELFLNGKSQGVRPMPKYRHAEWKVPYEPGQLVAKAYRSGKLIATELVSTTGRQASLRITTDRTKLKADGEDVTEVKVEVVDSAGRVVPDADNLIEFSIKGHAQIAGVGNGDPSSHEPDKASRRHAFHGLCMVLVGSKESAGNSSLIVTAKGLPTAVLNFTSN